ncbi:CBS domain-containing protein [Devosia sp. XJ19-1]|uniref:CBS domain-containing protein n=1 Tax=Devosia ureilytica TaxID=2952754 RepID=A0A9Q4APN7_9HYPH|nr:CBS domain-containing protein [Devosia ureilytica]MCP8883848.1 CBS domain-containing protein [Devosia ureilytica]MCP8887456.1 CBS domain-containing protein [Devosia ureilytica]
MHVDTILQTKGVAVHTLSKSGTLADAVALLNAHNIGAVVIVEDKGRIVGILSERDIVRQLGKSPTGALSLSIADCMTKDVVTAERTTTIDDVMERMTRRRIRHMPIADDGVLVGIISIGDVVKLKIAEVEHEAEALREYISS